MTDGYSATAHEQLDALEREDPDVYDAVLDACELVFLAEGLAQARSTAIVTPDRVVFRLPVVGSPIKVFWSNWGPEGPRVEAVFPYSSD